MTTPHTTAIRQAVLRVLDNAKDPWGRPLLIHRHQAPRSQGGEGEAQMSGKCARNCDLDCHPRYQSPRHPMWDKIFSARDEVNHERAVRRRAKISQSLRRAWARRKAKS